MTTPDAYATGWSAVGAGLGFLVIGGVAACRTLTTHGVGELVLADAVGARGGVLARQASGPANGRLHGADLLRRRLLLRFTHVLSATRRGCGKSTGAVQHEHQDQQQRGEPHHRLDAIEVADP